jgi:superfamily II DNA or RNA helicase
MPTSWRGTLVHHIGRLHREHHTKSEVIVYDYFDSGVPLPARMALKRQTGYRSLGYEISTQVVAAMTSARAAIWPLLCCQDVRVAAALRPSESTSDEFSESVTGGQSSAIV